MHWNFFLNRRLGWVKFTHVLQVKKKKKKHVPEVKVLNDPEVKFKCCLGKHGEWSQILQLSEGKTKLDIFLRYKLIMLLRERLDVFLRYKQRFPEVKVIHVPEIKTAHFPEV